MKTLRLIKDSICWDRVGDLTAKAVLYGACAFVVFLQLVTLITVRP